MRFLSPLPALALLGCDQAQPIAATGFDPPTPEEIRLAKRSPASVPIPMDQIVRGRVKSGQLSRSEARATLLRYGGGIRTVGDVD